VALYRQTLLSALGEVTDALSSTELAAEREASAKRALAAAQRDTRLNELRYREGDTELKALIDARWNQYEAEDLWLTAAQDQLIAAIDVFRATGGAPVSDGNRTS
jgi:outer membrane protein TolC